MAEDIRATLSLTEVAATLGIRLGKLHRIIARLRRDHGFPKPLPLINRYDPAAIADWERRCWSIEARAIGDTGSAPEAAELEAARARMAARAQGRAA
jgi:hypothetical protein